MSRFNTLVQLILLVTALWNLTACRTSNPKTLILFEPGLASRDRDDLIVSLIPSPGSRIVASYFEPEPDPERLLRLGKAPGNGIIVTFRLDVMPDNFPSRLSRADLPVNLYIDGERIANNNVVIAHETLVQNDYINRETGERIVEEIPLLVVGWTPEITPGSHEAKIEVSGNDEVVYDYGWSFEVLVERGE